MGNKLDDQGRTALLAELKGWSHDTERDAISRRFKFSDFKAAWAFMSKCALLAEEMNHHPEWFNVYGTVDVTLTTHDVDGLSDLDARMARQMEDWS